jgi:hypothetical protein
VNTRFIEGNGTVRFDHHDDTAEYDVLAKYARGEAVEA